MPGYNLEPKSTNENGLTRKRNGFPHKTPSRVLRESHSHKHNHTPLLRTQPLHVSTHPQSRARSFEELEFPAPMAVANAAVSKPGFFDRVSGLGPSFTGLAPSTARPASNFDRAGLPMLDRSELGPSLARLGLARKLVFFLANSNLVQPIRQGSRKRAKPAHLGPLG